MSIQKTAAIVLKTVDFRETSLIVNFYTKEFGKVKGILKGIRKEPRKFASTLEIFSYNEIVFYLHKNQDLHLISQCDLIDDFGPLRNNLEKFSLANYAVELTDSIVEPEDKNEELFYLLLAFLKELRLNNSDTEKLFCVFQIKAMILSGFKPNIEDCISCKKMISSGARFSYLRGGLICNSCLLHDPSAKQVLKGTIASLIYIGNNDWAGLRRLKLDPYIKKEIKSILDNFISFHLEKRLKSAEFMNRELLANTLR